MNPNDASRACLTEKPAPSERAPFVVEARSMGLRPGIDPTGFNKLADDLEADAFLELTAKLTRQAG